MRAVVTGASGFLGVSLIERLLENGNEVLAVIRPNSLNLSRIPKCNALSVVQIDANDISELCLNIKNQYDTFFHLAWSGIRGNDRNDADLQSKNYFNSVAAVETAFKIGCKTFVSTGSQAECGIKNEVIDENTSLEPVCEYGKSKVRCLNFEREYCYTHNMKFVWARIFSLYGKYDYSKSLINYAIDSMLQNKQVNFSPCTQMWDYLNVSDASRAILLAAESEINDIVNIADGNFKPLKDFIYEISDITKSNSKLVFADALSWKTPLVNLCPDVSYLKKRTGFNANVSFRNGIEELIALKVKGKNNEKN